MNQIDNRDWLLPVEGARPLRLAAVIPWRDLGRWIWRDLPENGYEADLLFAAPEPGNGGEGRSRWPAYLREFVHLAGRRPELHRYDVLFAWELRATLATALLRRLTGQRRSRLVAVGPILKGGILRALPLVRVLMADADRIVCFSRDECALTAHLLRLPRERFQFLPLPCDPEEPSASDEGFVLALGHSNRDYRLLVEALRGTEIPVTIVSRNLAWTRGLALPPHVTLRCNTGFHETRALVAGAALHVIPLRPVDFSSGQTVLLGAMGQGKAVIVSDVTGIRDYVRDGDTAVLVPPDDAAALRDAIRRLWDTPEERRRLGDNAAKAVREQFSFARFAHRLAAIAEELVGPNERSEQSA